MSHKLPCLTLSSPQKLTSVSWEHVDLLYVALKMGASPPLPPFFAGPAEQAFGYDSYLLHCLSFARSRPL